MGHHLIDDLIEKENDIKKEIITPLYVIRNMYDYILVSREIIKQTPNDSDLGQKIRKML
jgi:hypothetical protein